ncbi:hypothetical protein [Amycolatopsis sp. WGS_07]|uniref:hypothetical protein n=1 Tax=Amycolatopsis sp. WGS_07 TaxID=3076764 RepID=UPI0038732433
MKTIAQRLPVIAIRLIVAGDVLLSMGALMAIAEPSGPGVNFGAGGSFILGLCVTGAGLLLGIAAVLARLRGSGDRPPSARLLPWEQRRKRFTTVALGLSTLGAVVLGAGPLFFRGEPGTGFERDIPVFLVGLGISGAALLAGIPPVVYWWSKRGAGIGQ